MALKLDTTKPKASRARAHPAKDAGHAITGVEAITAQRIEHIAGLMRSLTFRRGKTAQRLAAEWSLSLDRVWQLTAEASRMVKAEITDPDRVTVTACGYVEWALREAKKSKDTRAIAPLAKAWAELAGTLVKKHEVASPKWAEATPDERARMLDAAEVAIGEERRKLLAAKGDAT